MPSSSASTSITSILMAAFAIACFFFFFLLFRFFFANPAASSPTSGGGPSRFSSGLPNGSKRRGDGGRTGCGTDGWGLAGEACALALVGVAMEL